MASSDLVHMGMAVVSYTIKDISDDAGYLAALGMTRTAQVRSAPPRPAASTPTSTSTFTITHLLSSHPLPLPLLGSLKVEASCGG